jgi:hypothetical protein
MAHHHIEKEKYEPTLDRVVYSNSLTLTTYDLRIMSIIRWFFVSVVL